MVLLDVPPVVCSGGTRILGGGPKIKYTACALNSSVNNHNYHTNNYEKVIVELDFTPSKKAHISLKVFNAFCLGVRLCGGSKEKLRRWVPCPLPVVLHGTFTN